MSATPAAPQPVVPRRDNHRGYSSCPFALNNDAFLAAAKMLGVSTKLALPPKPTSAMRAQAETPMRDPRAGLGSETLTPQDKARQRAGDAGTSGAAAAAAPAPTAPTDALANMNKRSAGILRNAVTKDAWRRAAHDGATVAGAGSKRQRESDDNDDGGRALDRRGDAAPALRAPVVVAVPAVSHGGAPAPTAAPAAGMGAVTGLPTGSNIPSAFPASVGGRAAAQKVADARHEALFGKKGGKKKH